MSMISIIKKKIGSNIMPTFKREQNIKNSQENNKFWWEKNPMSYDWEGKNNHPKYSVKWFDFIDKRFKDYSNVYHVFKNNFFDEFINFKEQDKKVILEIGCGYGLHTETIIKNCNFKKFYAIDITQESIMTTQKRLNIKKLNSHNIEIINADAENIPLQNNSIDTIWSWGVIHHSKNTEKIVTEIQRVLKKKGKFKIMVYNKLSIRYLIFGGFFHGILRFKLLKKSLEEINMEFTDGFYAKHFSKNEIIRLFKKNFLNINSIKNLQDAELVPIPGMIFFAKIKIIKYISDFFMKRYGWFLYFEGEKE
jgi:ubiquinone/menaquinone biosynthesis C-methylase UbiE